MTSAVDIALVIERDRQRAIIDAQHQLDGGTLLVVRSEQGVYRGTVALCNCGWSSDICFTSLTASALFRNHQDEVMKIVTAPWETRQLQTRLL